MRTFYNENGKPIMSVAIPFEEIPEEYELRPIKLDGFKDISYLGFIRELSESSDDFKTLLKNDEDAIGADILSHLAYDYLQSAICLQKSVMDDRYGPNLVASHYVIPCIFCCRHAIELKLKQCVYVVSKEKPNNHIIIDLWKKIISKKSGNRLNKLNDFICEINVMDSNEIVMRYGLDKNLKLLKEKYLIDIDALIENTKYLFNVLAVECSCF